MSELLIKAEKAYKNVTRKDPQTGELIQCPMAKSGQKIPVDQLFAEVSNNGQGIGKVSALKGAYYSLLSVIREHLMAGDTVYLDDFVRITCTIKGTVEESGTLSKERNSVHTVFLPHSNFQFKLEDFNWKNITDMAARPKITSIASCVTNAVKDTIVSGKDIRLYGKNLDNVKSVVLTWMDEGEKQSATVTPSEVESSTLRMTWPAALSEVEDKTEVTFTITVGTGEENNPFQTASRTATVSKK